MAVALLVSPLSAATTSDLAFQVRDCIKQAAALNTYWQMRDRLNTVCLPLANRLVIVACGYTVTPSSVSVPADVWIAALAVTAGSGCPWSVTTGASWLTSAPAAGTGAGTVTLTVAANPSTSPRTGTVTLAGTTVTVTQAGVPLPAPPNAVDFVDPGA